MEKIVLLGGGGHAKVLIDLINACGRYEIEGIVDAQLAAGVSVSESLCWAMTEFCQNSTKKDS